MNSVDAAFTVRIQTTGSCLLNTDPAQTAITTLLLDMSVMTVAMSWLRFVVAWCLLWSCCFPAVDFWLIVVILHLCVVCL